MEIKNIEIKNINYEAKLRVDSINILLRNDKAKDVQVICDITIGFMPTNFGAANFHFEPDEELIEFLNKKIEEAIKTDKISTSMPYLTKIDKK